MADPNKLEQEGDAAKAAGDNKLAGDKYSDAAKARSDAGDSKGAADDYGKASKSYEAAGDMKASGDADMAAGDAMTRFAEAFERDAAMQKLVARREDARGQAFEKLSDDADLTNAEKAALDKKAADAFDKAAKAQAQIETLEKAAADAYAGAARYYSQAVDDAKQRMDTLKLMGQPVGPARADGQAAAVAGIVAILEAAAATSASKASGKAKTRLEGKAAAQRKEAEKEKTKDF
jgi:hypothetical protein